MLKLISFPWKPLLGDSIVTIYWLLTNMGSMGSLKTENVGLIPDNCALGIAGSYETMYSHVFV